MIVWVFLTLLLLLIAYVLAMRSMSGYREEPKNLGLDCGLFLICNLKALNITVLNHLFSGAEKQGLIFSIEKLFRGSSQALVIYGPRLLLLPLEKTLGLQELEEYSGKTFPEVAIWEVGLKRANESKIESLNWGILVPPLTQFEGVWWQVVLQPKGRGLFDYLGKVGILEKIGRSRPEMALFQSSVRAVVMGVSRSRVQSLKEQLAKVGYDQGFSALPQAYSRDHLLNFYRQRSLAYGEKLASAGRVSELFLSPVEVLGLLGLS